MRPVAATSLAAAISTLICAACSTDQSVLTPKVSHSDVCSSCPPPPIPLVWATNAASITAYISTATGNVSPYTEISGSNTRLHSPAGIAVDVKSNVYVGESTTGILVFAGGASGNVSPATIIAGSNTGLVTVVGVALDNAGNIYAANLDYRLGSTINVFSAGATGNATPTAVIGGSNTGLGNNWASGIAVDNAGQVYVSLGNANKILVYAAGANGNVHPIATIAGNKTQLENPKGIAVDAGGKLYVANYGGAEPDSGAVFVYARGATGNVSPVQVIYGYLSYVVYPTGVAVDAGGVLYVTSPNIAGILSFQSAASDNNQWSTFIQGSKTDLNSPTSLTTSFNVP